MMTTEELEQKIEGQTENQNLDFKQDCAWNATSFAKDFLAMANVKDGGSIIIGIKEDETYTRQGVSPANKKTYKIDEMKDQVNRFADPNVDFNVFFPKDREGIEYIVIRIFPFKETPVICCRENQEAKLKAGTIYYRNTDRRTESAPVSNSNDMRDIIEVAASRLMMRRKEFGYTIVSSDQSFLQNELDGL